MIARLAAFAVALLTSTFLLAQDNDTCLACHGDSDSFDATQGHLVVDIDVYAESIHGLMELECVACHTDLAGQEEIPHSTPLAAAKCDDCHEDAARAYQTGVHGYALQRVQAAGVRVEGARPPPTCASCHTAHAIRPSDDPMSTTHRLAIADTCARCHGQPGLGADGIVQLPQIALAYEESVHGQLVRSGSIEAATCTDCHDAHQTRGATDSASGIHPTHLAETCGACHGDIADRYQKSIHGRALAAGVSDSPTCTSCHGEHRILSPRLSQAETHSTQLATATCGACHDDPRLAAKYGLSPDVVGSYVDSYHGWATRRASETAATCVSCHSAHDVLPASEPASTIHPDNVMGTCQRCHPSADAAFAASYTHESASISANPINRWIRSFYLVLIAAVIGGMLLHNALIMNYYLMERRRAEARQAQIERLDRAQRLQHACLAFSFIALVVTGFALRFPEAWWVQALTALGMTEGVRGVAHRGFAAALVLLSFFHLYYILLTRRGRRELGAMLPNVTDIREATDNLRFHTWLRDERPSFGRYDYTHKAEYWALVWGTALMAGTGFVLWFPERAATILPAWSIPASQTVHYYEAWLATLAILVWHFFFVIFHPEAYPMSWTWMTGKITAEHARRHHPRWHEEETGPIAPRTPDATRSGSDQ
jgi:formate dehydrogenase gamma subunit